MKRFLVVAVVLIMVVSVFSTGFQDVRQDHWAYDYVYNLTSKGIIPMDVNVFRGYEPLTRSEASIWITNAVMYLENSPLIAKTPDLQRLTDRVRRLERENLEVKRELADFHDFQQRITRHLLMQKYDTFDKIDAVEDRIFYLESDVKELKELTDRVQSSENDIIQLQAAARAAYSGRNLANALADDFLILIADVDDAIRTLNHVEEVVYERGYELEDMHRAIARINTFNTNQSQAISRIARRSTENEAAIKALEEKLEDDLFAVRRQSNINKNTLDAIIEDMFLMVDDHNSLAARTTELETKVEELEASKPNLLPLYLLSLLGIGLGIAGIFMPLAD